MVFLRVSLPTEVFLIHLEIVFLVQRVQRQFGKMYIGWMTLLLINMQNTPTRTPKLLAQIRIRGQRSAIQRFVVLGIQIDFLIDKVLAGCLFNIFLDFLIYIMQKKNMYAFFLFLCHPGEYSFGLLHTEKIFTWGFRLYDAMI